MKQQPVDYVIFDLLHLDGRRVRDLPYIQRRELLEGLGLDGRAGGRPATASTAAPTCWRLPAARASRASSPSARDSPYRPGKRTGEWIKTRVWRRQEFVIGGYIPGEGSRAKRVGSVLVGYYDKRASELRKGKTQKLHFAGGVGSGLKESDLDFLTRELRKRERPDSPFDVGAPARPEGALRGLVRAGAGLRGLAGRSGPTRAPCASRRSRECATTRTRARSSRSSRRPPMSLRAPGRSNQA